MGVCGVSHCGLIYVLLEAGLAVTPHLSEQQLGQWFVEVLNVLERGDVCMFGIRSRDCNVCKWIVRFKVSASEELGALLVTLNLKVSLHFL